MTRPLSTLTTCGAALLLMYGAAAAQTPARDGPAVESREAAARQPTQLADEDRQFIQKAAQSGNMEIAASISATKKTQNAQIKSFAEQMVKDHTEAGDALTAIAKSKGVTAPTEPSAEQKAMLDALNEKEGDAFDREYAQKVGVAAHEEAVKLFEQATKQVKDEDLKAYAEKTLPTLQHHLDMARQLAGKAAK